MRNSNAFLAAVEMLLLLALREAYEQPDAMSRPGPGRRRAGLSSLSGAELALRRQPGLGQHAVQALVDVGLQFRRGIGGQRPGLAGEGFQRQVRFALAGEDGQAAFQAGQFGFDVGAGVHGPILGPGPSTARVADVAVA